MIVKNNNGQPCESCRVELVEENRDAARVLMMVRTQTVSTPVKDGMIVDLNLQAVKIAMDLHGVRPGDQLDCFQRVRRAWFELRGKE